MIVTAFVLEMLPPGGSPEYWPEGFGFDTHTHATEITSAKRFPSALAAMRAGNGYRRPAAFWESERRHAALMREKFDRWRFAAIEMEE